MKNSIRCISIAIIEYQKKILVFKEYEPFRSEYFHRPLGGEIEFRETAIQALRREFKEELDISLFNIQLLTVIENLFEYRKKAKHEIVFLFKASVVEDDFYQRKDLKILDDESVELAWIPIDDFKKGKAIIYPNEILDYL